MPEITTLFWDVGGVMLSNGWDTPERAAAIRKFGLDAADFEARHEVENPAWECGSITLAAYLNRTVFYKPRAFTPEEFREFIFAQSRDLPEGHAIADEIARSGRYSMAVVNNESTELNLYRIQKFGLRRSFPAFFSSCFVGVRKPDRGIYRIALDVTQRTPGECLFIDDRAANLETARQMGMHTIQFQGGEQLRRDLAAQGVVWQPSV